MGCCNQPGHSHDDLDEDDGGGDDDYVGNDDFANKNVHSRRKQVEEAQEIAAINLAKYRQANYS